MGPKKGPTAKQLVIQHELEALKMHIKACCRARGLDYAQPNSKSFTAVLNEKIETFKSLQKVICQGPDIGAQFAEVMCDMLAGYSKVKNLCFWGAAIGDGGLLALADLLQSAGSQWYKGSKLIHLEITCDGNQVPPTEWPGMSASLRQSGITSQSAVQGPGAALPSLLFKDTPMVVAPDIPAYDAEEESTDVTGIEEGAAPPAYKFSGPLGAPLARPWSEAAVSRLAITLGTKGLKLKILVLDHNIFDKNLMLQLARGIERCFTLKQLSLAYCGLDASCASSIALLLETEPGSYGQKDPQALHLQNINLQGNPLEGDGLMEVSKGLAKNLTLTAINLADISVTVDDTDALYEFRGALNLHPSMFKIDFSMNQIEDEGVRLLLPMLESRTNIKAFRLTHRISRETAKEFHEMMIKRCVKPKKKKVLRKKKAADVALPSAADLLAAAEGGGSIPGAFGDGDVDAEGENDDEDEAPKPADLSMSGIGEALPSDADVQPSEALPVEP